MFGIGMSEMIIICAVALLVFGPEELPQIVKKIARGLGEVRKASDDLRRSIDLDDDEEDRRARAFARAKLAEPAPSPASAVAADAPALTEPAVIPGSALTAAHGEEGPVVVAAGAVAVGAAEDHEDEEAGEVVRAAAPATASGDGAPARPGRDDAAPSPTEREPEGRS